MLNWLLSQSGKVLRSFKKSLIISLDPGENVLNNANFESLKIELLKKQTSQEQRRQPGRAGGSS